MRGAGEGVALPAAAIPGSMEASRLSLAAMTSAGVGDEAGARGAAVGWAG